MYIINPINSTLLSGGQRLHMLSYIKRSFSLHIFGLLFLTFSVRLLVIHQIILYLEHFSASCAFRVLAVLGLDAYFGHVRASSVAMFADVYVYAPGGHACMLLYATLSARGGDALS